MLRNRNIAPPGYYSAAAKAARAVRAQTCAVSDCEQPAVTRCLIAIDGHVKRVLPVCQQHADAAEDLPSL